MSKLFAPLIGLLSVLFLGGCIYYTPKALRAQVYGAKVENKLVKVTARELTKPDLDFYFKHNLNSNRIRAVQVNIFNQAAQPLSLDGRNIDLELEDLGVVTPKLHYNTVGRVILWSLPGIFYWPFFLGAVADGYNCWLQNRRVNEDLEQKILTNNSKITIRPYASVNRVMFIREANYYNNFTLTFMKKDSKDPIELLINI